MASGISPTRHCFFYEHMYSTIDQHNYNLNQLAYDVLARVGWRDGQTIKLQREYNEKDNMRSFYNEFGTISGAPFSYFNDEHPLLTTENLFSIAPDFRNSVSDAADDKEVSEAFTAWLKEKTIAYICKAIREFVNSKITSREHRTILESTDVFPGATRTTEVFNAATSPLYNYLFGFEIVPARQSESLVINIDHISLNVDARKGKLGYYGWITDWKQAMVAEVIDSAGNVVYTVDSNYGVNTQTPISLPNNNGSYYVVFRFPENSRITGEYPIFVKRRDWSKGPCETCSPSEGRAWRTMSKFVEIHPFICSEEGQYDPETGRYVFSPSLIKYDYTTNFGIEAKISVMCDLSIFIKRNIDMFIPYIMKSVAIDFLREMAYNPNTRTNRNSINASKTEILYELDGDSSSMKKSGLIYKLEEYLKALRIDTTGIDRICLPCKNNGVKYRTV